MATHPHPAMNLRMRGGFPLLPHTRSWHGQGQLYLVYFYYDDDDDDMITEGRKRFAVGGMLAAN